jgi:MFS family permease
MCASASAINLPYMLYFILFGVGGILTSSLTDKLGRRRSHWLFSTGHLIAQALILFVPNQIAHVIGFSMLGFFMAKNTLCFTYAFEFMVKDHKGCASTCLNMLDFSVCVIAGLFFLLATPRWELLCYPLFAAGAIGFVIVSLLLPESPKWLLLQGR